MLSQSRSASCAVAALALTVFNQAPALAAAPLNDNCANAIELTVNDFSAVLDLSQATVQSCEAIAPCEGSTQRSVWYRLTPNQDGLLFVSASFIQNGEVPLVAVFEGCATPLFGDCVQPQALACQAGLTFMGNTYATIFDFPVQANQPLLIKIAMQAGSGHAVGVDIEFHASPSNDLCSNATEVTSALFTDSVDFEGTPIDQTECDGTHLGCSSASPFRTVWYKFDAPADGTIEVNTNGSSCDTMITAFDGCPVPIMSGCISNELACADDPSANGATLELNVDAGASYLIRVAENGTWIDDLIVQINLTFSPANDHCSQATAIKDNTSNPPPLPIAAADATEQEPLENCDTAVIGVHQSVFYKFTAPEEGLADINTFGSSYDTVLSVYDGCGMIVLPNNWLQPTLLACNNDAGGVLGAVSSITNLPMQAGQTYIIKVAANASAQPQALLDFNFTFTSTACPSDVAPAGGNGVVDVDDLLAVISSWGPCDDPFVCPTDIAPNGGNSIVDVDDLLTIISNWGACP